MLCIYIDKVNSKSVEIGQAIYNAITLSKIPANIQEYSENHNYSSISLFIIVDSIFSVPVSSKYCILSSIIWQNTITEEFHNIIGYNPAFVEYFTSENPEDLVKLHLPKLLQIIPRIPGYNHVNYYSNISTARYAEYQRYNPIKIEPLYEDHEYVALHIELETIETYIPACNLALFPENSDEIVDYLMKLQNYPSDFSFSIQDNKVFENPISARDALKKICDLTSLIRKPILKLLSSYCILLEDQVKLEFLTSLKGKNEFRDVIEEQYLSIPEIMEKFNIKIPLGDLVQTLDKIKPRYFTVCSAPSIHSSLQFVIKVNKKGNFIGLASRYLENMLKTHMNPIQGYLKPSVFIPIQGIPILMISSGCGIAPFRSMLLEMQRKTEEYPLINLILGFRTRKHFLYKDNIERIMKTQERELLKYEHNPDILEKENSLVDNVFVGYSREGEKTYVQDIINFHKEKI